MTKKNIRPQQAAPVQREIAAKSSVGEKGMVPLWEGSLVQIGAPFAGDDAE
ncbi:anacyclamide/piricyclamide family prenylated cyclic peptide [Floridanema evergladense]|uniref:Anacyclamide/piricyclamide family prenylated cyclic peptide n=1 Tax=Floridaenema evergladense BLCC-F167 TaxID=3153639 RepID=A0ABV4WMH7_9CYAN